VPSCCRGGSHFLQSWHTRLWHPWLHGDCGGAFGYWHSDGRSSRWRITPQTHRHRAASTQIQGSHLEALETGADAGGLYIPDTAKEKPQQGEVVAVGPGKMTDEGKRVPSELKAGDRVLYGKYSGTEVTVGDEQYLILRESDVLAVIKS
jgi:chaperonin GroES